MFKKKLAVFLVVVFAIGLMLFIFSALSKRQLASLEVDSNTTNLVYVDGKEVGRTNYTGTFPAGEADVKVGGYQTRVNLQEGIKTIIVREFDSTSGDSFGEVVSFEKLSGKDTGLAVVSTPDASQVVVDGVSRGFTPLKVDDLTPGTHQISISANGYIARKFPVNIAPGYKLVAIVDLFTDKSFKTLVPTATPAVTTNNEIFVTILSTPTGYLRVRSQPTIASDEVGQVRPGEKYKFIQQDKSTGWFDIQIDATSSGWISDVYATSSSQIKN